jgi:hypothetical protein
MDQRLALGGSVLNHANKGFEDETRGRLACLETLLMVFAAHIARHVDDNGGDLVMFTSSIFDEAENSLLEAAQEAVGTAGDAAAIYAISAYRRLSTQMYDHVQREAARRRSR